MNPDMWMVSFELQKEILDTSISEKLDTGIDRIVEKYGLVYAVDGHYIIPEDADAQAVIREIADTVKLDPVISAYIVVKAWKLIDEA